MDCRQTAVTTPTVLLNVEEGEAHSSINNFFTTIEDDAHNE